MKWTCFQRDDCVGKLTADLYALEIWIRHCEESVAQGSGAWLVEK